MKTKRLYTVTARPLGGFVVRAIAIAVFALANVPFAGTNAYGGDSIAWAHSFTVGEGQGPSAGLILADNGNLYGTAVAATSKGGPFFQVTPNGTFTVLYTFSADGSDGGASRSALLQGVDDAGKKVFYGTCINGGAYTLGSVFRITTDGTPAGTTSTVIHSFGPVFPDDGGGPSGGLVDGGDGGSGNRILYGTTQGGGATYNKGILFKLTTNGTPGGTTFVILHRFGQLDDNFNYDGAYPYVTLVKGSDGNFYGTTSDDGTSGYGTIFEFLPSNGGFHTLYAVTQANGGGSGPSGLVEGSPGVFYGTANAGGAHFEGSVFKFTLNGSFGGTYTRIYSFSAVDQTGFNSDGANPLGGLSRDSDGNFYGTTTFGGTHGRGSVFTITPDGMLTPLYFFTAVDANHENADGADPQGGVVRDGTGHLYGTAQQGGLSALGSVFRLNPGALPAITAFSASGPISAGNPMHFSAMTAASENVHVQFTTTPDAENSWTTLLDGGAMMEQPANSGNYSLDSTAYPAGTGFYFRAVASRPGFVDTVSPAPYPGPFDNLHPPAGLYETTFTVNESSLPSGNVVDTVLRFAAKQGGRPAGLFVRVQASTSPGVPGSWTDLTDNNNGRMGFDGAIGQFVLNSTSYPQQNDVFFRVVAAGEGVPDNISNVVGGFNLASSVAHVTPPAMFFTGNGNIADLYFRAAFPAAPSGVGVRIQASTAPGDESSWSDLANGNSGQMTQSIDPKQFLLLVNQYPAVNGTYFRAVSSSASSISGLSLPCGPFNLVSDTPPTVTITPPTGLNGDGHGHSPEDPVIYLTGPLHFTGQAATQRPMKEFKLQCDGSAFSVSATSTVPTDPTSPIDDLTPSIGDHVIDAVAIDELGARSRAGTGLLYVRVVPGGSAAKTTGTHGVEGAALGGKVFHVVTESGYWTNPTTWQDSEGNNGVPGIFDLAIVGASSVVFEPDSGHDVGSLSISGGQLYGPAAIGVTRIITVSGGSFDNGMSLIIRQGAVLELTNSSNFIFRAGSDGVFGTLLNSGTINVHGSGSLVGVSDFSNHGVLNWNVPLAIPPNGAADPAAATRLLQSHSFSNSGTVTGNASALHGPDGSTLISHDGAGIIGHDGAGNPIPSKVVSNDGGTIVVAGAGNIVAQGAGNIVAQGAGNIVAQGAGNVVSNDGGTSRPASSGGHGATSTGFTQTAGETNLTAVSIVGPVVLNGGVLSGSGIIDGDLTNNSGYIAPGHSAGRIAVTGNFVQGSNGTLIVENGGFYPSQFDQLQVGGSASLGGRLDVKTINGYVPLLVDAFSPIGYSSVTGSFASVSSNAQVTANATGLMTSVDSTMPQPSSGQALNISTRMRVLTDDNVLIAGFIVTGPSGATKKVLIRGMGPSLAQSGVPGTLPDPFLELHEPDGSVVANDNWADAPNVGEIPPGFEPGDPRESIVIATLTPGSYTAIVKGAHGETGVGLVEVYDLDSSSPAKLANISTRGFIDTGDNVMIGGFIVGGGEPARILVRAIGPTLADVGVQGALADPVLELHDANGSSFDNDNWRESQESEIMATTIPPHNDREPAILATLVPGNYTAIVRGKNDTTGIGLVEAYNLQ